MKADLFELINRSAAVNSPWWHSTISSGIITLHASQRRPSNRTSLLHTDFLHLWQRMTKKSEHGGITNTSDQTTPPSLGVHTSEVIMEVVAELEWDWMRVGRDSACKRCKLPEKHGKWQPWPPQWHEPSEPRWFWMASTRLEERECNPRCRPQLTLGISKHDFMPLVWWTQSMSVATRCPTPWLNGCQKSRYHPSPKCLFLVGKANPSTQNLWVHDGLISTHESSNDFADSSYP